MFEFRQQGLDGASLARRSYWRAARPLRQAWLHRDISAADLTIASYPRSGNLWLRFLLLHVLIGRTPGHLEALELVPHLGFHYDAPKLLPGGGRLLKSHEPYRRAYKRAVYIVRDPRDVALSYFRHLQHRGSLVIAAQDEAEAFDRYLDAFLLGRHEPHGQWDRHVVSWLEAADTGRSNILMLRYEQLRDDPRGHLERLTKWLDLETDAADLDGAVEDSSIEHMRALTRAFDESSNERQGREPDTFQLVGLGQVGGWREMLTADQARRFRVFNKGIARAGYDLA